MNNSLEELIALVDSTNGIDQQNRNIRRHNNIADAHLKHQLEECYEPIEDEENPMNVFANNIIADVQQLSDIVAAKQGIPRAQPLPRRLPWYRWIWRAILASVVIGALLVLLALLIYVLIDPGGPDTNVILLPGDPSQVQD